MFRRIHFLTVACLLCLIFSTLYLPFMANSQDEASNEKIIERYKLMLSRKPKEGSTFDRLYQFYLEGAGLDAMVADYQAEAQAKPNDPNLQLILGHIYKRLGKDAEAVAAYQRAVEFAPSKYYSHFALGQMHEALRQHGDAIQALTKAAALSEQTQDVPPEELTAIYKALGNAYFRRDRVDEAIQAWQKISELDPQDIFARIELADLFREQELYEEAIAQHEAIIQLKKDDPYRICLSHREIGNIYESKGDYQNAIQSYDAALTLTAPGNWLRKDLQHRIIGIFAADSNWKGLIEYYQEKLETSPNEPELLGLLAAAYIENQQLEEGIEAYRKGLELASTDANLRLNLITALRNAEKFVEAAAEYEVLSEQDPDNFGIYRELGELYLQIESENKAKATYQRMIDRDPNNASTHLILAEIYAGHEWIDDAIAQYEKTISLAPNNLDYIEYFGEFYFRQGNREKALETWNRMVAADKGIAENYNRLAQLLYAKNFKTEAIAAVRKAVELMPDEYRYRETLAKHLMDNRKFDEALTEYTAAMKLAPNQFFAEKMDDKRIELYRRQGTLVDKIEALETELEKPGLTDTGKFTHQKQLSKMYLKLGNVTYALEVLLKAKQLKPNDVVVNRWLAQVYSRQGRRDEANAIYMHLIEVDGANAREYHANIAKSYLNVMDFGAATTAAKQVIANSPRNPEGHQLLAQIAKQSRNYDTAIDSLKQAIRLRPEAIDTRAELAAIYKLSGKLQQALAQYWRCWDLSRTVSEKLAFVGPLSEAYYDLGRRGEFEEKLKQLSKSSTSDVAPVLALSELYRMDGDLPNARFQLARALDKDRKNPDLLSKLVEISLDLGDNQDALTYQQRLVKAHPESFHQQKFGELLFDAGREQEAIQAWTKLLHAKNQTLEADVKLAALLLRHGLSDEAFLVLDRAAEKITGTDAHIPLYRLGVMLVGMNESERATTYFHKILDMPEPPQNMSKQKDARPTIFASSSIPGIEINKFEISRGSIGRIQSKPTFAGASMPWMPKTFEEAQAGALVQLTTIAQQQGKLPELVKHFETDAETNPTNIKTLETLAQFYTLIQNNDKAKNVIDKLIEISPNDLAYQPLRLQRLIQEDLSYETLKESLADMPGLVPEARLRYIGEYAKELYRDDKKEDAKKLLSEIEDIKVTDFSTGYELVDAFHVTKKIDIAEKILINLPIPPQKQHGQYRRLFERLTDTYIDQGELDKTVALFWTFCERTKPNASNPRRVAALSLANYYYGSYRPVQSTFPTPTAYFNQERLNYLRSIFREFWMRDQQEVLYKKFQKELDAAEGRDRVYPSLALSYCYWWDGKRDLAQEVLSTLQKEFPDDLTLKLNTAFVSIQTGEFREALVMLEDLVEREPRNRRQYYDLLLQLAVHTGDAVTIRDLIAKILNSPTGAQELYDFSQSLQDAGFTQYAIAAAKKAMALAMTQRSPNFLMNLSQHLGQLGRGQDAALLAERALRFANQPDRYGRTMYAWNFQQATNIVGRSQSMQDRENHFIAEVEKNPESFQAQIRLAMFYEGTNKIDKASEAFKAALKLQPKDSATRLRHIQMLERNGKAVDAVPEYSILLKNNSTALGYNYRNAIDAFVEAGKMDELIALTKEIILPVGQYAGNDFTQEVAQRCLTEDRPQDAVDIFEKILQVHPSWDYIHRELASAYVAAGDPEKAIQYLTEKQKLGKTSLSQTQFVLKLAEFHEKAGGREKAIQYLREQSKTDDISDIQVSYVLRLANLYKKNDESEDEKSDELESFIAEYEAKLAESPSDAKLLYLVASMKLKADDIEGASLHVNHLIENALTSVSTQWLYNLANACEGNELQFRLLEAAAEKLESQNSWELEECYKKLGEAYAKADELEKAQDAFRKMGTIQTMQDSSRSVYEKRQLGSKYMQHQMWDDAEAIFTEIINDLSASSYNREYAQDRFMRIKQQRGDLDATEELAEKTQEMSIGMQRAMAEEFVQRDEEDKAIEIYERIVETVPEDFKSRAQLAKLYTSMDQHEKAAQTWTELLEADPENTKYQDGLVKSYQDADKPNDALELAQKYIEAEPEIGVHYVRLAKLYADENKPDEALTTYQKAIELAPGDRQIHLDMAALYFSNDDVAATEKAFRDAIQYTVSDYDRRNIERKLINLYRYQGNLEEMLQKAEDEGTLTFEMQKVRAEHFLNAGELEKSVDAYKRARDMTTSSYEKERISAELLKVYVELGEMDSVIETYETQANTNTNSRTLRYSSSYSSLGITARYDVDTARDTLISAFNDQIKLDDLKTHYEGKLEENKENSVALRVMAKIYWDAKDYQKAAEMYKALGKAKSDDLRNLYYAAAALEKNKQPELVKETLKRAEKALASSSKRTDMWFLGTVATFCIENKMYEPAIELTKSAIDASSSYSGSSIQDTLREMLAKSYREAKRYEEAIDAYQEMASRATSDSTRNKAKNAVREIAKDGKLYEKWIPEQLKKVEENPNDSKLILKLAESYEATNKTKEAIGQYVKLSTLQPKKTQWHKKLGDLYQNLPPAPERRKTGEVVEGTALTLGGNGSFVEIGDSESLNNITDQVTVSAWIKPTKFPNGYSPFISKTDEWDSNFKKRSFFLNLKDDRSIQFAASPDGESDASIYSSKGIIEPNTWHHIAGVVDTKNDIIKLFIDGIQVNQRDFKGEQRIYQSNLALRIGWTHEEVSAHTAFVGQIDEVCVWNVARTEQQIRANMYTQLNGDEPGLLGYWKFDAETEGRVSDSSPHKNDGKLIGNAKLAPYTRPVFESVGDTALSLDGNGSYVEINGSESLNEITEQVTVSAWIKPTDFLNTYTTVLFKGDKRIPDISHRQFTLWLFDEGKILFNASPGGHPQKFIWSPPNTIEKNKWYHVAGTIDAKNDIMKLYLNGFEVGRNDFKQANSLRKTTLPFRIGCSHEEEISEHASFAGLIDEVRIWNIARTEKQIRSDMNKQLNGDETGLVSYWKFDAETDGRVSDSSPHKNDGKLIGNAKLESYTRPIFGSLKTEHLIKATSSYEKAIELQPKSYQSYDLLAKLFVKQNLTSEAETVYRRALDAPLTQGNHNSAIRAIADLYTDEGQENKRIAILKELIPKGQGSAELHELLGDLYKKTDESEKAELAYAKWLKIREKAVNKQSAYYQRRFAEELLEKGLYPDIALKFAKRALQGYTGTSYYYPMTLGHACIANERYDDALRNYKYALSIITSDYSSEQFWKKVADLRKKANDKERYAQMLDGLIKTIPPESSSNRAHAYRTLAQFYSENDTPENVESYLFSKTGFVPETRWITLGPFKNVDSIGHRNAYIPEETSQIDTTAKYYGKDGLISWKESEYVLLDGHYNFGSDKDGQAAYVWAIVISPDKRDITFRFDSDDQGTIWLNGQHVFKHDRTSGISFDRYTIPVTLKQGENTILMKICNSTQSWGFYLRLTDEDGTPFTDLKFKTAEELLNAPPPKPSFHLNVNLGLAEYYSKNNMPDKAMKQMLQTGIVHENAWLILGTLDNTNGIGYNTAYIAEDITQIDKTAKYEGVGEQISWKKLTDDVFDGFIDFGKDINWRVSYAWATVISPDEREVQFRFGSDDEGKIWLNGKEVFAKPNGGWAVIDDNVIPVTLKAGKNTILVKVCNKELSWGFYLRITDADGKPFEDLKIGDASVD